VKNWKYKVIFALVGVALTGWLGSGSLYVAYNAIDLTASMIGLSSAAFFIYMGLATFGMVVLDLTPEKTRAAYSGIVSMIGRIGGVTAPIIIGYLASETGTFLSGFMFMIAALCIAAECALALTRFSSPRQTIIVASPALDVGD